MTIGSAYNPNAISKNATGLKTIPKRIAEKMQCQNRWSTSKFDGRGAHDATNRTIQWRDGRMIWLTMNFSKLNSKFDLVMLNGADD